MTSNLNLLLSTQKHAQSLKQYAKLCATTVLKNPLEIKTKTRDILRMILLVSEIIV